MTSNANMTPVRYRSGPIRQVCVNRKAIEYNLKNGTNYPTTIVVDNGQFHEYHSVYTVNSILSFDRDRKDLPAKVFIETRDDIIGYVNPNTSHRSFLNLEFPTGFWFNIKKRFFSFMGATPVINCVANFESLKEELEQPKKLSEPVVKQEEKAPTQRGCF